MTKRKVVSKSKGKVQPVLNFKVKKPGHFKSKFSYYAVNTLVKMSQVPDTFLYKQLGVSKVTWNKLKNNKSGKAKLRISTLKKITQGISGMFDSQGYLWFSLCVDHYKRYRGLRPKMVEKYRDKSYKLEKSLSKEDSKDEYLFFRILYGRSQKNEKGKREVKQKTKADNKKSRSGSETRNKTRPTKRRAGSSRKK